MSVPMLTPADSAIFDEDVIAEMQEHLDEVVPCVVRKCDAEATHAIVLKCCSRSWLTCDRHLHKGRIEVEFELTLRAVLSVRLKCALCLAPLPTGALFGDVYRVVPL